MNKILGIFGLLILVCLFTSVLSGSFVSAYNMYNITRWSSLFGILGIGVAFVIITGGIDLSIGSVVGLIACMLPMLIVDHGVSPPLAIMIVMCVAATLGLIHGLLITRLQLQPFVVTLCGLLIYRSIARWLPDDQTLGLGGDFDEGVRLLAIGKPCSWATLLMIGGCLLILYAVATVIRKKIHNQAFEGESAWSTWITLGCGAMLAVIGSSRFWQGFDVNNGVIWLTWGAYRVRFLAVSVPDAAVTTPGFLLKLLGWMCFVPAAIFFVYQGWMEKREAVQKPLIGLIVASLAFLVFVFTVVPLFDDVSKEDLLRVGGVQLSGRLFKTLIMVSVFFSVGALMGLLGWLLASVTRFSKKAKAILPLVVVSGVCGLLGMTQMGETMVPMPTLILIVLAIVASIFLNRTIYGRYLLALGRNEEAARLSGINTARMTVIAYVICSMAAGLGGVLFSLDINSVQPAGFGNFYELYAIAAAVLGGCSLRGGEGSIVGVVIGAAVMRVLYNAINTLGISTTLEFAIIGTVILTGAIVDVLVNRIVARRAALADAAMRESETGDGDSSG